MARLASVEILGAGPAGLYTAILLRRLMPHVRVRVAEQNPEGATFGFGVVFSEQALEFLKSDDPETHDLVTDGPYRWIRHPLYTAGLILLAGISLAAANVFMMAFVVLIAGLILSVVIPKEEAALIERFGEAYRAYRRQTGRLFPSGRGM